MGFERYKEGGRREGRRGDWKEGEVLIKPFDLTMPYFSCFGKIPKWVVRSSSAGNSNN